MAFWHWIVVAMLMMASSIGFAEEGSCRILDVSEKDANNALIYKRIDEIIQSHRGRNGEALAALFHPRLKITDGFVLGSLANQKVELSAPIDYSIYRVWELNDVSVDGISCPDGSYLYAHYGYKKQIFVSLQAQGQNELGRVMLTLVPDNWQIGYYHFRPLTFQGQNPGYWARNAKEALTKGQKARAYIFWTLAEKLLRPDGHFILPEYLMLRQEAASEINKEVAVAKLASISKLFTLIEVESIFHKDGPGMLLRWQSPDWKTAAEHKDFCETVRDELKKDAEFAGFKVFICALNHEKEDPTKDGPMGSLQVKL